MNVKDQIRNCPRLTEEEKADALKRIERIENDPEEKWECLYAGDDADANINDFCQWHLTKDGEVYWTKIYFKIVGV